MRGAVTSHDGHDLLREYRSTRAQNWASRKRAFTFGQEKNKRFASSGICGHSQSGRTQTNLNGRGGMSFGSLRRDRRAVQVSAFTSCDSKNYDCLQPPVRKVLAFLLCRLTDVRHAPSEPPAKRTLADGDRRECLRSAAAARCAWLSWTAFPTNNSSLSIISYEKASQVFEEKELDKHSAVSCQAGGSGEGEWSRRVALHMHKACMGVQVHTGTRILGCPSNFFSVPKSGGGGSPSKFFGNTDFKKLRKLRTTPN